jgi:hypothetical protein
LAVNQTRPAQPSLYKIAMYVIAIQKEPSTSRRQFIDTFATECSPLSRLCKDERLPWISVAKQFTFLRA